MILNTFSNITYKFQNIHCSAIFLHYDFDKYGIHNFSCDTVTYCLYSSYLKAAVLSYIGYKAFYIIMHFFLEKMNNCYICKLRFTNVLSICSYSFDTEGVVSSWYGDVGSILIRSSYCCSFLQK